MKNLSNNIKPTNQKIFDEIVKRIEENGNLPNILDYALAPIIEEYEFTNHEMEPCYKLDYGISEGIYLNVYVEYKIKGTGNKEKVKLGILKRY